MALRLKYQELPRHFTWDSSESKWKPAGRGRVTAEPGVKTTGNIGRVYTVSPRMKEWFYLRLL